MLVDGLYRTACPNCGGWPVYIEIKGGKITSWKPTMCCERNNELITQQSLAYRADNYPQAFTKIDKWPDVIL